MEQLVVSFVKEHASHYFVEEKCDLFDFMLFCHLVQSFGRKNNILLTESELKKFCNELFLGFQVVPEISTAREATEYLEGFLETRHIKKFSSDEFFGSSCLHARRTGDITLV